MRIAPELAGVLAALPAFDPLADPVTTRAYLRAAFAAKPPVTDARLTVEDAVIDGPAGELPIRFYRPSGAADAALPAVLYFHGGAFISGDLDTGDANCRDICLATHAVVVSVDYRLAPEHPYPAAFDDCFAALRWTADNTRALGVDADRLAVAGRSAGAALAAGVALAARDRGGPALVHQLLLAPTFDDRCDQPSVDEITDPRVIDGNAVRGMWLPYLGSGQADQYAAPARAADLGGLPPAYLMICEQDALRDQGLDYARRLTAAGVPTEIHLVPGAFHVFDGYAPNSPLAGRATAAWTSALASALSTPPRDGDARRTGVEIYDQWTRLWNLDLALAEEIMAPELTLRYAQPGAEVFDKIRTPQQLAAAITAFHKVRPGLLFTPEGEAAVDLEFVDGRPNGLVARPYRASRPGDGGREVAVSGTDILRISDGLISEVWSVSGGAGGRTFNY
ncbi:alpha/beta hydrolase fold domain-containing protein [Kitasatospora sp. NPDC058190]|uniref:alpha/beta hydrolase fold domain-containing protein n=1 Tax=Kitasatospora sp. NPDC058190 TaxID=3346371 RepID=UPI0036DEBE21